MLFFFCKPILKDSIAFFFGGGGGGDGPVHCFWYQSFLFMNYSLRRQVCIFLCAFGPFKAMTIVWLVQFTHTTAFSRSDTVLIQ